MNGFFSEFAIFGIDEFGLVGGCLSRIRPGDDGLDDLIGIFCRIYVMVDGVSLGVDEWVMMKRGAVWLGWMHINKW